MLTADDFGGQFPSVIKKIEIRWKNEISQTVSSPIGQRNMIVQFLPVTKSDH